MHCYIIMSIIISVIRIVLQQTQTKPVIPYFSQSECAEATLKNNNNLLLFISVLVLL